jgi:hypothetical protein
VAGPTTATWDHVNSKRNKRQICNENGDEVITFVEQGQKAK